MARTAASHRRGTPAKAPVAFNSSISKFGRISKAHQPLSNAKLEKKVLAVCLPNAKPQSVTVTHVEDSSDEENRNTQQAAPSIELKKTASNSKKRKAGSAEEGAERNHDSTERTLKRSRVIREQPEEISLGSPILPVAAAPKIKTSASADARRKATKKDASKNKKGDHSKKTEAKGASQGQLPAELVDLLDMQRAILKTVVLQITHQNNNTPINISDIVPHVSRTWGKRRITVDDIRRCIAIQDMKPHGQTVAATGSPFIVTDYGRGKLCLEMDSTHTADGAPPLDEDKLCRQFEENLHALFAERTMDEMTDLDVCFDRLKLSVDDLPKSDITPRNAHLTGRNNPLLAKGHRALLDFKQGMAQKQREKEAKATGVESAVAAAPASAPHLNPDGTKMSLLDRIRAKEAANAQVEAPSGPELARKRALQRVGDVAAIIGMLASSSNPAGAPVLSYTMAILQQKLKDSMRVPMPVEEGIDTVKLIAGEVAPEWLRVVSMGGKEHVVVQTRGKPYESDICARVSKLLA